MLLPHLETLSKKREFAEIIPHRPEDQPETTGRSGGRYLPEVRIYPDDQITDRSERFMASEMVREKITRQLGAELPYSVAVEIEEFKHQGKTLHISALILVERKASENHHR